MTRTIQRGAPERRLRRPPATFTEADQELALVLDALTEATNYADWIVEMARPHLQRGAGAEAPTAEILEVGAGHGTITERLARYGKVTAADLSPRCVDTLRQRYARDDRIDVVQGDVEAAVDGRQFDAIVLVNVLEHIEDDRAALRAIRRGLRPGGSVVLFVPAFEGLYSTFDAMVGHHRRYRRDALAGDVIDAGFELRDARYVNCVGAAAWWLIARQLGRFPKSSSSVRAYDRTVTRVVRKVESRWTPPFGQSVLCVGRRPVSPGDT